MRSRAYRRHQEDRIKHKVSHYFHGVFRNDPRRVGCLAHTRMPCSCWKCGNPRRRGELTVQELKAAEINLQSGII